MRKAYQDGLDIYAWIGSMVYKVPYEDCKEFYPDGKTNPEGKQKGVTSITVDGKPIKGNIIKATPGEHTVEVVM